MDIPNLATGTMANEVTFDFVTGVARRLYLARMGNLGIALFEIT